MEEIVDLVLVKTKKPISMDKVYEKVERKLGEDYVLSNVEKEKIESIVLDGVNDYKYIKTPSDNYISIKKTSFKKGRFIGDRTGAGKVVVTDSYTNKEGKLVVKEEKYLIDRDDAVNAVDGDLVLIDTYKVKNSKVLRGKVTTIIDRKINSIVGEVTKIGNSYFVKSTDKKKGNIQVAINDDRVIEGQKVSVLLEQKTGENFYIGKINHIFNKYDPDDDILYEALKCGVVVDFSDESIKQAKNISQKVLDSEKIGRCDLTDWEIFTIDGRDTKDIDDALSIKKLDNGNYLVGVHIADVSHYVKEGSPLDIDAFSKGTSAYLAGKVIPMLPKELSNGICSLNPNVERLALSCMMEINSNGEVVNHDVWKSIIKSNMQMNYDSVNDILKGKNVDEGYDIHVESLKRLNALALILRSNRLSDGAVEFNKGELKVNIAENGKVSGFSIRNQDMAENLIEEFMLLANETIDKHLCDRGIPCLHRVHDIPSRERLEEFLNMLDAIGYKYNKYDADACCTDTRKLQDLAEFINNTGSLREMLSTNLVRCMSRAKYSNHNIGHSGLAKSNYCHFTSPIRRYPDLIIHRTLKDCFFNKDNIEENKRKWKVKLPEIALQTSKMERVADEAENETLYMRCAEYMNQFIGQDFTGTIIGIGKKGIQIQLDNYIEGKVRFRNLTGQYEYNPETYSLISIDGRDDYFIGDRLSLKVVSADKNTKVIDFKINFKLEEKNLKNTQNEKVRQKVLEEREYKKYYNI